MTDRRKDGKTERRKARESSPSVVPSFRLSARLHALGLPRLKPVVPHTNRRVLVSLTARGALRVHAGYAAAPDEVLSAIVRWARPRVRRAERLEAQRVMTAFPVHDHVAPAERQRRRTVRLLPGDARVLERLQSLHSELNARCFGGRLRRVEIRLSSRMRRRLGEFRPAESGEGAEIALSRRHLNADGWARVTETLLHEMVHQWQAESGHRLGHGADFRRKCAAIGIEGRAVARPRDDLYNYPHSWR